MTNTKKLVKINKNAVTFTPVTGSSIIESYARASNDLAVKLVSGATYIYKNVDQATVDGFVAAASKGKYFGANIRNKFTAEQAE
jgi:KTSC domain